MHEYGAFVTVSEHRQRQRPSQKSVPTGSGTDKSKEPKGYVYSSKIELLNQAPIVTLKHLYDESH